MQNVKPHSSCCCANLEKEIVISAAAFMKTLQMWMLCFVCGLVIWICRYLLLTYFAHWPAMKKYGSISAAIQSSVIALSVALIIINKWRIEEEFEDEIDFEPYVSLWCYYYHYYPFFKISFVTPLTGGWNEISLLIQKWLFLSCRMNKKRMYMSESIVHHCSSLFKRGNKIWGWKHEKCKYSFWLVILMK